jgi:hypothetical protein
MDSFKRWLGGWMVGVGARLICAGSGWAWGRPVTLSEVFIGIIRHMHEQEVRAEPYPPGELPGPDLGGEGGV